LNTGKIYDIERDQQDRLVEYFKNKYGKQILPTMKINFKKCYEKYCARCAKI